MHKVLSLALAFSLIATFLAGTVFSQRTTRNLASSQQIDPIRSGDQVEVKYLGNWIPGNVISFADGKASVEYERLGRANTRDFSLSDIRFPNGEGQWAVWKDASGKFKVEARYIARDETSVMIRKADGTEATIPIATLSLDLRQRVKRTPITGEENKRDGAEPVRVGDHVQVRNSSRDWSDGVVQRILIGAAEVEYQRNGRTDTKRFSFNDIRFPNGEGRWREWSDASGQFKIIARYISRTETDVSIRKEDGQDLTIPIERLSSALRRLLAETPVTGKETLIDGVNPIRVGDTVQAHIGSTWYDGVIRESRPGAALVEYKFSSNSDPRKQEFELTDIRYPNGEGHWRKWSDQSGSFEIVARFIKRNETTVTLQKEDDTQVSVPIDRLSSKLRRMLDEALVITPKPEKIEFAMSPKTTSFLSNAPNFSELSLSGLQPPPAPPMSDGGFGFQLTHGDSISAAIPTAGSNPWIVVGTYGSDRYRGAKLTRLYWTNPNQRKVVPGPNFQANERIVDYSAAQERVITVQVSDGHWEQPEMFCSYRVQAGTKYAKPEAAWDIAEKKQSYGRGSNYLARLVGEDQLLLADGNSVSLYDFGSQRITYTLGGLADNDFTLHPSKKYFAVTKAEGGVSLHETSSGLPIAAQTGTGRIGFSQDGTKVLQVGRQEISIWDMQQNSPPRTLKTRNMSTTGSVTLLNDQWIWANSTIYNIEKEMVVWTYSGSGVSISRSQMIGNHMLVAGTGGPYSGPKVALVGIAQVPHQNAIDEMNKVDADAMIMLKPGAGVRIEAPDNSPVREGLLRAIEANDWVEDPSSEIVLRGTAEREKSKQITYESSNRFSIGFRRRPSQPRISETVNVTPWQQRVSISFRGQQAWSTNMGGIPYSLYLKEGESVQAKVAAATQPSYALFNDLKIPGEMLYPQYRYGLGRTSITSSGFRDTVNELKPAAAGQ